MTEEDVKAMHALNEDVAAAVRWLGREGAAADIRMINAATLLTRAGLRIEKMIGDAEEVMAHDRRVIPLDLRDIANVGAVA